MMKNNLSDKEISEKYKNTHNTQYKWLLYWRFKLYCNRQNKWLTKNEPLKFPRDIYVFNLFIGK